MTKIKQHVQALAGFNEEQKTAITGHISMAGGQDLEKEVSAPEFAKILEVIGPQSAARADMLFLGFKTQQQVDDIVASLNTVTTMTEVAIGQAGVHNTFSSSPYEVVFGKHAIGSGTSWALRVGKVQAVLREIHGGVGNRWIFRNEPKSGDVASYSRPKPGARASNAIAIGGKFPAGGGKFAAGVLIHEMGHWAGLVDICSECLKEEIKKAHFQEYTTLALDCKLNDVHGAMAAKKKDKPAAKATAKPQGKAPAKPAAPVSTERKGHFISWSRTQLLATTQKNLTVWNADSYRWYCSSFFKPEIAVGAQRVTGDVFKW